MSDSKTPPTAAQIAWLLQRRDLDVTRAQRHAVDGWTIWLGANGETDDIVSDDLLETVPVEQTRWGVIVAEYADSTDKLRIERDELRAKLEELDWAMDEAGDWYHGGKPIEITAAPASEPEGSIRGDTFTGIRGGTWDRCAEYRNGERVERGDRSIMTNGVPDYHPGAVVHCQCQYDPDE